MVHGDRAVDLETEAADVVARFLIGGQAADLLSGLRGTVIVQGARRADVRWFGFQDLVDVGVVTVGREIDAPPIAGSRLGRRGIRNAEIAVVVRVRQRQPVGIEAGRYGI